MNEDVADVLVWIFVGLTLCFIGAAIVGWILNIVAVAKSQDLTTAMFVLRCIGILIAPIGAVLGFV